MPTEIQIPESRIDRDTVINAAMQAVPYVGGSLATLYFGHKQERRFRRLETFYNEISNEISGLREQIADTSEHSPDELRAILEELHEKVESEQLEAKRQYYKTYFKSTLVAPVRGNFEERKLFLDVLGALTTLQLEVLAFLVGQGKPIQATSIQKPGTDSALIIGTIAQLKNYGLTVSKLDSLSFGSGGGRMSESVSVSDFGQRFHRFCVEGLIQ